KPSVKLAGTVLIALIPVVGYDMTFERIGLPLLGTIDFGWWAYPVSIAWIALVANLVNLIDGMDALAAGMVAIACATFAILDTSFVVAKRLKYKRAPWGADHNHFYHRFLRIGFSQRRTAAYLHVWAALLAGYALLLRFVPPRPFGVWDRGNTLIALGAGLLV